MPSESESNPRRSSSDGWWTPPDLLGALSGWACWSRRPLHERRHEIDRLGTRELLLPLERAPRIERERVADRGPGSVPGAAPGTPAQRQNVHRRRLEGRPVRQRPARAYGFDVP